MTIFLTDGNLSDTILKKERLVMSFMDSCSSDCSSPCPIILFADGILVPIFRE